MTSILFLLFLALFTLNLFCNAEKCCKFYLSPPASTVVVQMKNRIIGSVPHHSFQNQYSTSHIVPQPPPLSNYFFYQPNGNTNVAQNEFENTIYNSNQGQQPHYVTAVYPQSYYQLPGYLPPQTQPMVVAQNESQRSNPETAYYVSSAYFAPSPNEENRSIEQNQNNQPQQIQSQEAFIHSSPEYIVSNGNNAAQNVPHISFKQTGVSPVTDTSITVSEQHLPTTMENIHLQKDDILNNENSTNISHSSTYTTEKATIATPTTTYNLANPTISDLQITDNRSPTQTPHHTIVGSSPQTIGNPSISYTKTSSIPTNSVASSSLSIDTPGQKLVQNSDTIPVSHTQSSNTQPSIVPNIQNVTQNPRIQTNKAKTDNEASFTTTTNALSNTIPSSARPSNNKSSITHSNMVAISAAASVSQTPMHQQRVETTKPTSSITTKPNERTNIPQNSSTVKSRIPTPSTTPANPSNKGEINPDAQRYEDRQYDQSSANIFIKTNFLCLLSTASLYLINAFL